MRKVVGITTIVLVIVGLVFLGANSFGDERKSGQTQVGRFQLFQGTFMVLDAKNNRVDKEIVIFLLDTSTGKVKRYETGLTKDGTFFEDWIDTEKLY